eukprot:Selendium_serpulae@DN6311_c1_g3_i2.p1
MAPARKSAIGQQSDVFAEPSAHNGRGGRQHLRHTGASLRPLVADDDHLAFGDCLAFHGGQHLFFRVEHVCGTSEVCALIASQLCDCAIWGEVPAENFDVSLGVEGVVLGVMNYVLRRKVQRLCSLEVFTQGASRDGQAVGVEQSDVQQMLQHRGGPANSRRRTEKQRQYLLSPQLMTSRLESFRRKSRLPDGRVERCRSSRRACSCRIPGGRCSRRTIGRTYKVRSNQTPHAAHLDHPISHPHISGAKRQKGGCSAAVQLGLLFQPEVIGSAAEEDEEEAVKLFRRVGGPPPDGAAVSAVHSVSPLVVVESPSVGRPCRVDAEPGRRSAPSGSALRSARSCAAKCEAAKPRTHEAKLQLVNPTTQCAALGWRPSLCHTMCSWPVDA